MACLALSSTAIQLDCEYIQGGWSALGANDYRCEVKNLNITTRNVKVDGVLINHANGNNNVKGLRIESQTCHFIPKGIANVFGNLIVIRIQDSDLKQITRRDLQPFTELETLYLYTNDLEVIEKDLFMHNKKLIHIDCDRNKLKHIDNMALDSLTQLTSADFQNNPCISMNANTEDKIPELKNKIAQSCRNIELAQQHDEDVASRKGHLPVKGSSEAKDNQVDAIFASIHAMSLRISALEEQNLLLMKKLKMETKPKWKPKANEMELKCKITGSHKCDAIELFVAYSDVSIGQVIDDTENMLEVKDVKEVSIEKQETFFLPTNLHQLFPILEKLSIAASRLVAIDNVILIGFKNLKQLSLTGNRIKSISASDFAGLTKVTELDLSLNRIADIEAGSFEGLESLKQLNFGGNFLTTFNFKLLAKAQGLKEINLFANELKSVKVTSAEALKQFTSIKLSENKCINIDYPLKTLDELKKTIAEKCAPPPTLCCELESDGNDGLNCR